MKRKYPISLHKPRKIFGPCSPRRGHDEPVKIKEPKIVRKSKNYYSNSTKWERLTVKKN